MKKYQDGFTLIEIVIVLSVIAIFMAFLTPYLLSFVTESKIVALQKNIETIESALVRFSAHTGSFPADNDPEPNNQCGEETDIDLVGDPVIENDESEDEGEGEEDSGLLYNAGNKDGWLGPYLDPKKPPKKAVTGGSILYKIDNFGDFFHENRMDIVLIITICPETTSHETIFRGLDKKLDQRNGAQKGFIFIQNASDDNDFGSGNLVVVIFPDAI